MNANPSHGWILFPLMDECSFNSWMDVIRIYGWNLGVLYMPCMVGQIGWIWWKTLAHKWMEMQNAFACLVLWGLGTSWGGMSHDIIVSGVSNYGVCPCPMRCPLWGIWVSAMWWAWISERAVKWAQQMVCSLYLACFHYVKAPAENFRVQQGQVFHFS
jgi:hypothetical protein